MRILVIGGGGREHAFTWALARSPQRPDLFIAPGNAGAAALGRNVAIQPTDIAGMLAFARQERIDLTVVGPEAPLVEGLADAFEAAGLPVVGPSAAAARLEGSKAFAKAFMERHGVPTAAHRTFTADQYDAATAYLEAQGAPIVVKASGLAAGKGAIVCATMDEARAALDQVMRTEQLEQAAGLTVTEYLAIGGGAASPLWRQMLADASGKTVLISDTVEASALGAGMIAAQGGGWYPTITDAAQAMAGETKAVEPDAARAPRYRALLDIYKDLYGATAATSHWLVAFASEDRDA